MCILKIKDLTKGQLKKIVENSSNITDALRNIGYTNPRAKHTRDSFKKIVARDEIDISHFKTHRDINGNPYVYRHNLEDILVENSSYKGNTSAIKNRLVREGLLIYKCSKCTLVDEWNHEPLSLHLDHINGKRSDYRLENLRLLCPNCHSQTDTYCSKNIKRDNISKVEKKKRKRLPDTINCKNCNDEFHPFNHSQNFCSPSCARMDQIKINITKEELNKLIHEKSFIEIGRMFNVSDNAIRRWCKKYELPFRKKDIIKN